MKRLILLLLALGVGCASSAQQSDRTPTPTARGYKLVVADADVFVLGYRDPRFQPWFRVSDPVGGPSIYAFIARTGELCIVPGSAWAVAPIGVPVTCEWRRPRFGGTEHRTGIKAAQVVGLKTTDS
jgi:hypothetical protein